MGQEAENRAVACAGPHARAGWQEMTHRDTTRHTKFPGQWLRKTWCESSAQDFTQWKLDLKSEVNLHMDENKDDFTKRAVSKTNYLWLNHLLRLFFCPRFSDVAKKSLWKYRRCPGQRLEEGTFQVSPSLLRSGFCFTSRKGDSWRQLAQSFPVPNPILLVYASLWVHVSL